MSSAEFDWPGDSKNGSRIWEACWSYHNFGLTISEALDSMDVCQISGDWSKDLGGYHQKKNASSVEKYQD